MSPDQPATAADDPHYRRNWRKRVNDLLFFAAFVGVYLLLQLVILPKLGVQT